MAKERKNPAAKKLNTKAKKKPLAASTQHNEFTGTIAFDGRITSTGTLRELATLCNVPADYYPVGFYLHGLTHPDGIAEFQVAAAKGGIEEVTAYMNSPKQMKQLVVRMFGGRINLNELGKYFKMLSVAVILKRLDGRKVVYDPSQSVDRPDDV